MVQGQAVSVRDGESLESNERGEQPDPVEVEVLVLAYRPEAGSLRRCLESALAFSRSRVVVAINNDAAEIIDLVATTVQPWADRVRIAQLGRNWGYAGGINRGISHCSAPFLLLLNDDAALTGDALAVLCADLKSAPKDIVAICPKIVFQGRPDMIDACGAFTTRRGATFNRGASEIDNGQYDREREVVGACFAAVLVRRSAFEPKAVGLLAEQFFMYSEDADWCLRARLQGLRFRFNPAAVVTHVHSASTGALPSTFKADLIERNSWYVAVRCFPWRDASFVVMARMARHLWRITAGPERMRSARILTNLLRTSGWLLQSRRTIRGGLLRRHANDRTLFVSFELRTPFSASPEYPAPTGRKHRVGRSGD